MKAKDLKKLATEIDAKWGILYLLASIKLKGCEEQNLILSGLHPALLVHLRSMRSII